MPRRELLKNKRIIIITYSPTFKRTGATDLRNARSRLEDIKSQLSYGCNHNDMTLLQQYLPWTGAFQYLFTCTGTHQYLSRWTSALQQLFKGAGAVRYLLGGTGVLVVRLSTSCHLHVAEGEDEGTTRWAALKSTFLDLLLPILSFINLLAVHAHILPVQEYKGNLNFGSLVWEGNQLTVQYRTELQLIQGQTLQKMRPFECKIELHCYIRLLRFFFSLMQHERKL